MATKTTGEKIDPALVSLWLERYQDLEARLSHQPDGQWAWLWRVRRDILIYLLDRYGPKNWSGQAVEKTSKTKSKSTPASESVASYVQQVAGISSGQGAKHPPRGQGVFRSRLERLRSINDKVREEYPVDMNPNIGVDPYALIVRTTYPESPRSDENQLHCRVLLEVFGQELEGIRACLAQNGHSSPEDKPLTESEVLTILMGDVEVDYPPPT